METFFGTCPYSGGVLRTLFGSWRGMEDPAHCSVLFQTKKNFQCLPYKFLCLEALKDQNIHLCFLDKYTKGSFFFAWDSTSSTSRDYAARVTWNIELKRRISKIAGVPIIYITQHKYSIDHLPEATIGGAPRI